VADVTTLFVGLGSAHGDDQVGWLVAERLRGRLAVRQATIPAQVLDWLDGVESLHLCDACRGTETSGRLHHLTWSRGDATRPGVLAEVVRLRSSGTHDFGLGVVLDLADRLGKLPESVHLWAVEGTDFGPGDPLSPLLSKSLPRIVDEIWGSMTHARTLAGTIAAAAGRTSSD
jgi:hydrogenase maturation protease